MKNRATGLPLIAAVATLVGTTATAQEIIECTAPADWFPHSQTPRQNDNADFDSNCAFHQWSWNAFLWLTQDDGSGQPRFLSMIPAADVVSGNLSSDNTTAALRPRSKKTDMGGAFDEVNQAGSLGLLVDQNGRAVYYSMLVNQTYFDFAVTENQFNIPENLRKAPDTLNFPIGALSLKASWKIVAEGEDTSGFFTKPASVQMLKNTPSGNIALDPARTQDVTVALVGLHVVGIVKDHPEAIWATFEHRGNAPDMPAGIGMNDPVSESDFTFYAKGTTAGQCNQNNAGFLSLTDPDAQVFSPVTQACRQYAFGGGDAQNVANISSLNASVDAQFAPESIWRNYMETGAIWFAAVDGLQPNMAMRGDILTGSVKLSNATIETFTQKVRSEDQCFSCHRTDAVYPTEAPDKVLPGKNLNISHILLNAYVQNLE